MLFWAHLTVLGLTYKRVEEKLQKSHISVSSSKSCSEFIWPFYYLLQLYEGKSLQKSSFSSPWVQCTSITNRVLSYGFLQLYEVKLQKSHIREFSAQVSQIVTILRLSEFIWPFYDLLQLYEEKLQKSHISVSSVHKYHKSCSEFICPFYDFLQLYEEKLQKSHISVSSVQKYKKSCSRLIWPF